MKMLVHEINKAEKRAKDLNLPFAIRLNCTSDLSPELFVDPETGKNILELFPDVQFYDYTKVPNRIKLLGKYGNYDLTFSFDGYNWQTAKEFIENGGRAAVVFAGDKLPETYKGYKVINGNNYDMRFLDPGKCVIGLSYHPVANDYKVINGVRTFVAPDTKFVVKTA